MRLLLAMVGKDLRRRARSPLPTLLLLLFPLLFAGMIALTFGGGDNPPLYVADMGNQRIVQLAADGTYQRQFRPPFDSADFQGLRDVFLDENNRLYVLTTQGLYRYELPGE